ncbi:MAG: beta-lactamase family protein [Pseudomonadota bacterium]|nr:beta-lactamase family protein [Pseudomonadota bacterium]
MKRRTWFKGLWVLASGPLASRALLVDTAEAQTVSAATGDSLDAMLQPYLARFGLPAIGAAVLSGGKPVASGAVGTRRVGFDIPVHVTDKFHIGSGTKAMTVLLAALYIEQGKLRWDTRMEEAFPELAARMDPELRTATVTQLMSHTSGLPNDEEAPKMERLMNQAMLQPGNMDAQRYWMVQQIVPDKLPRKPGAAWAYSNIGYVVLGSILERIGGKTWEELIAEKVFAPLHLDSAGFGPQSSIGFVDAPLGHDIVNGKPFAYLVGPNGDNPVVIGPAGTVHLSVLDFAAWASWQVAEGKRGPHLVSDATMRRMHTRVVDTPKLKNAPTGTPGSVAAKDLGYALGWGIVTPSFSKDPFIFHGGSNSRNYAMILLQPQYDFAMVLVTNIVVPKIDNAFRDIGAELYAKYAPR